MTLSCIAHKSLGLNLPNRVNFRSLNLRDQLTRKRDEIGKHLLPLPGGHLRLRREDSVDNHVGPTVVNSVNDAIPGR
jgi:hypothetical protein